MFNKKGLGSKRRLVVLISGNGTNLQAILDAIKKEKLYAEVSMVLSNKEAFGLQRAEKEGVPNFHLPRNKNLPRKAYEDELIEYIDTVQPDVVVLAGWMLILTPHFIEHYKNKDVPIINLHPALPNSYVGTHCIKKAWDNREKQNYSGLMVHHVVPEVDRGEVVCHWKVPILDDDTFETFEKRMRDAEKPLLLKAIDKVIGVRCGKVRNMFELGSNLMAIDHSDRLSSFDRAICNVPGKGLVLCKMSEWFFKNTRHIIPNHLLYSEGKVMVVKKCRPIMLEVVVRAYITGSTRTSMWTNYKNGVRYFCGNHLPEGLVKNQKLDRLYLTPTTKAEIGDESITPDEIVERNLLTQEEWEYVSGKALELFRFGSMVAEANGLILVDTKYEFGWDKDGNIILMDEVHTADSSRYWLQESYQERFDQGLEPEKYDKDIVRNHLKKLDWDPYDLSQDIPELPEELIVNTITAYRALAGRICGGGLDTNSSFTVDTVVDNYFNNVMDTVVIVSGSVRDEAFVNKIRGKLDEYGMHHVWYPLSAHKNTRELLEVLDKYEKHRGKVVYVTVAGRSNALSGVIAANSSYPVVACPPFKDKMDMMVNINSTIQMPSSTPVMLILDPGNTALAVHRMMNLE